MASIDIGSNTVRLLAAEVAEGKLARQVLEMRAITRLSEGLKDKGRLKPEAASRTLDTLAGFASALERAGVEAVSAVATEALRKAADAADFVKMAKERAGLDIEILAGEEEARRTLMGIRAGIGARLGPGPKLLMDIGGGSSEVVATTDWEEYTAVSVPVGAVSLYERFLMNDPPSVKELSEMESFCFGALSPVDALVAKGAVPTLVGTAGTITTLAAVDMAMDVYDPERVTGHEMERERILRLLWRFASLSKEKRMLIAGLEPGREDIILSGTALLLTLMDRVGAGRIVVCDWGLREGNLIDFHEKTARTR